MSEPESPTRRRSGWDLLALLGGITVVIFGFLTVGEGLTRWLAWALVAVGVLEVASAGWRLSRKV